MDYEEYRRKYFASPQPEARFALRGLHGATLYYADYDAAVDFVSKVFGPPNYLEGEHTRGWKLGDSWLTLFPAKAGAPANLEVPLYLDSAAELDELYAVFIAAGATGEPPAENLMYAPVRMAIVTDPFGVNWDLVAVLLAT